MGRSPLLASLAAALVFCACEGSIVPHPRTPGTPSPEPTDSGIATPSFPPTPTPTPAQVVYRVKSGDSLTKICTRFNRTIGQVLTANPKITDPNHIEIGQLIVIPPEDAPDIPPSIASGVDPTDDMVDLAGHSTSAPGYADYVGLASRLQPFDLQIELQLVTSPPRVDPSVESLLYSINLDTTGDGQPDYVISYGNAMPGFTGYTASLRNRSTAAELAGDLFPGTLTVSDTAIQILVSLEALGSADGTGDFAAAGSVSWTFRPGGPADSEVQTSTDLAPDQQWPRPNARWVTVGR